MMCFKPGDLIESLGSYYIVLQNDEHIFTAFKVETGQIFEYLSYWFRHSKIIKEFYSCR